MNTEIQSETLTRFINRNRITASAEYADQNPNMFSNDEEWNRSASHWKITLRCRGRQMTTYFSQGSAHTKEPTAADLLDCLASDSSRIENAGFEDWCREYGYDTDSPKAEKTYKLCERQAEKLKKFLPSGEYEMLLWHVERE